MAFKKLIFILFLILFFQKGFAQSKDVVIFYDRKWQCVESDNSNIAYFRRTTIPNLSLVYFEGLVTDYFASGKKLMTGFYKDGSKDGEFIFYHENGQIEKKGFYKKNIKDGKWTYLYENGNMKQVIEFIANDFIVWEYYDENGQKLLENGTGKWITPLFKEDLLQRTLEAYFENGKKTGLWKYNATKGGSLILTEKFDKGKFKTAILHSLAVKEGETLRNENRDKYDLDAMKFLHTEQFNCFSKKGIAPDIPYFYEPAPQEVDEEKETKQTNSFEVEIANIPINTNDLTIYEKLDSNAYFIGDKKLIKNINYPLEARRKGIKGEVVVSFVVEKDGNLSNFKVEKSIGGGCDEEAIRVTQSLQKYFPAIFQGKRVRQKLKKSITFKLN